MKDCCVISKWCDNTRNDTLGDSFLKSGCPHLWRSLDSLNTLLTDLDVSDCSGMHVRRGRHHGFGEEHWVADRRVVLWRCGNNRDGALGDSFSESSCPHLRCSIKSLQLDHALGNSLLKSSFPIRLARCGSRKSLRCTSSHSLSKRLIPIGLERHIAPESLTKWLTLNLLFHFRNRNSRLPDSKLPLRRLTQRNRRLRLPHISTRQDSALPHRLQRLTLRDRKVRREFRIVNGWRAGRFS